MLIRTVSIGGYDGELMLYLPSDAGEDADGLGGVEGLVETGVPIFGLDYMKNSCATWTGWSWPILAVPRPSVLLPGGHCLDDLRGSPEFTLLLPVPRLSFKYGETEILAHCGSTVCG